MTIFVTNGDAPLSAAQLDKRTQAYIDRDWPQWERERSIRNNDGLFNAYMSTVSDDTDANRDNNIFNQQLVDYRQAVARLEKYRLADGKPEQSFEMPTGEFDPETGEEIVETSIVPAIEPLEATVEQPVYDELTGEQTGTETVPNPLIVNDDAERAAAQAIVDATPQEVKDFE
jgi:hypothetical protein